MVTMVTKATMAAKVIMLTKVNMKHGNHDEGNQGMVTKINNHTSLYGSIASGTSVDPTSQVFSSTILFLLMVGN
jgi:hypothetical protein